MPNEIADFHGPQYGFLSNFAPSPIIYENIVYPTVEHAFQAAKTLDPTQRRKIAALQSPGQAKRAGRQVQLRPDWEAAKDDIMLQLLRTKFTPQDDSQSGFARRLLATGNAKLIEGNVWHDNYWGDCSCSRCQKLTGKNKLGALLMQVRAELKGGMQP